MVPTISCIASSDRHTIVHLHRGSVVRSSRYLQVWDLVLVHPTVANTLCRGVANHKIRKALRDAQRLQGSDEKDYLTPNALAAAPTANKRSKLLAEMESPTAPQKHQNRDEKSDIVSEPDSTPLDARPPSYAEVEYQDRK